MPKPIVQNLAKQIGKLTEETIREVVNAPGDAAGKILEQMGGGSSQSQTSQKTNPAQTQIQQELAQKEALDKAKSNQQIAVLKKQLEEEIAQWRRTREEQLRQRRQKQESPSEEQKKAEAPLVEPKAKQSRGLFAGMRARKDQSQPELAGKRVSG